MVGTIPGLNRLYGRQKEHPPKMSMSEMPGTCKNSSLHHKGELRLQCRIKVANQLFLKQKNTESII